MDKNFLNELQSIAMESIGLEMPAVDPYAGSECAEELIALDVVDRAEVAMESYEEALFAEAFEAQEVALESEGLTFGEIEKFNSELAMESVTNAIKRGAYGVEIQVKKLVQKIAKLVVAIFDYFMVADGKFKSYNKLFKKYRAKLEVAKYEAKEPKEGQEAKEKTFKIRKYPDLAARHAAFETMAGAAGLANLLTSIKSSDLDKIEEGIVTLSGVANKPADGTEGQFIADVKKKFKEDIDASKKAFTEDTVTEEMSFADAKSYLLGVSKAAEAQTAKDVKYKADFAKVKAGINKLGAGKKDVDAATIARVQKISVVLTAYRNKLSSEYKLLASGYQGTLADMAKVIAAGSFAE